VGTQRSFLPTAPDAGLRALAGRLTDLANRLLALASRVDTAETDVSALEAADVALDGRLDTAETDIDDLETLTTPSTWTGVTFEGTWVNFGSTFQEVEYRKVGDVVQVRGLAKDGTVGSVIFTLPSGFRPPADLHFINYSAAAPGGFVVNTVGEVDSIFGSNGTFALNFEFSTSS
jgi:hypothetical protein